MKDFASIGSKYPRNELYRAVSHGADLDAVRERLDLSLSYSTVPKQKYPGYLAATCLPVMKKENSAPALYLKEFRDSIVKVQAAQTDFSVKKRKMPNFLRIAIDLHHMHKTRYITISPKANTLNPIQKNLMTRWSPYFSYTMMILEFLLLFWMIARYGIAPLSVNPLIGPTFDSFVHLGAAVPSQVARNFPTNGWRLISTVFLHAGVVHYLGNAIGHATLGADLERLWGPRVVFIFLSSGIFGSMCTVLIRTKDVVALGASGGIFGLFGATFADIYINYAVIYRPAMQLIYWSTSVVFMFALGLLPIMDNITHTSGFVMGLAAGAVVVPDITRQKRWVKIIGVSVWMAMYILCLAALLARRKPNCAPWCCWLLMSVSC